MVFGSNGLVGSELLDLLLDNDYYLTVVSVTRKPMELTHPRLIQVMLTADRIDEYREFLGATDVYCCIGTTMKEAGSKEAFRSIDYDYVLKIAQACAANHSSQFLLISSIGASTKSNYFYSRVKGEIEQAVSKIPFKGTHLFQPSFLLGDRDESRPGEALAKSLTSTFQFLMVGKFRKYRPIHAKTVARAMFSVAQKVKKGIFTYPSDEIALIGNEHTETSV
jgi:uncharacterized protein YbjT (DUF2867 family)